MARSGSKSRSTARSAGVVAGLAGRAFVYARRVDWPAVWLRARWLSHHTRRLYANLTPEERREFLAIVVPTRDATYLPKDERDRLRYLVTKAFSGPAPPAA